MRATGTKALITLKLFPGTDLWERIAPVLDQVHRELELPVDLGQYLGAVTPQASRLPEMRELRVPIRGRNGFRRRKPLLWLLIFITVEHCIGGSNITMHPTLNTPGPEQTITPALTDMPATQVDDAYRFFFERALDMLCIAGADGYFKELNPAWERVLGYTRTELCSVPFVTFVHPDDQAATITESQKLTEPGVEMISFENRYQCKDGSYRWLRWSASTDHEHGLIYAIARDVTEQRAAPRRCKRVKPASARSPRTSPAPSFSSLSVMASGRWTLSLSASRRSPA